MLTALTGARVLTPDEEIERGTVVIEDGRIVEVGSGVRPPPRAAVTHLPNTTLAPGFIDIHVHGGGGFSLATPDAEELRSYARWEYGIPEVAWVLAEASRRTNVRLQNSRPSRGSRPRRSRSFRRLYGKPTLRVREVAIDTRRIQFITASGVPELQRECQRR